MEIAVHRLAATPPWTFISIAAHAVTTSARPRPNTLTLIPSAQPTAQNKSSVIRRSQDCSGASPDRSVGMMGAKPCPQFNATASDPASPLALCDISDGSTIPKSPTTKYECRSFCITPSNSALIYKNIGAHSDERPRA